MRYLSAVNLLLVLVLFVPSIAYATDTEGDTANLGRDVAEDLEEKMEGETNPIAKAIGIVVSPIAAPLSAFFTKMNEKIDYFVTLINLLLIVNLLVVSQIIILKIWRGLFKVIIFSYFAYQLLTSPNSEIPDVIEAISNGKTQYSEGLKKRLKGKKSTIAKLSTVVTYMLQ